MANQRMGFEGIIYYGVTGSTASTQITNATDLAYNLNNEEGSTTVRGDSTIPPIDTIGITSRLATIEWTMINDSSDATLASLRSAAALSTSVAIRTKDYSSGTGFDGDCYVTCENGMPLKGEQTFVFTAKPNRNTRTPTLNS